MRQIATVTIEEGRAAVPDELLRAWELRDGDKVVVELADDGTEHPLLRPARSVADLTYGAYKSTLPLPDALEFNRQFEEAVVDEYLAETPHAATRPT